ncbi:SDR family oxidoreductase [Pseudothioglobus sp. nBUS_23]|uniref:SDR family oxidoreductase n=1 Tax=Pseudothioglobus sp. nBUS_23 TaxID=3395318 RepID=UPI003EBB0B34
MKNVLVFGGSGQIGSTIVEKFISKSWNTLSVGRKKIISESYLSWDPFQVMPTKDFEKLSQFGVFDAVCWSQGMNLSDNIFNYKKDLHEDIYRANVLYILESLKFLINSNLLNKPAKFCVISSIWQDLSKENKLSYSISKAALKGLVLSLSNDMAEDGHLINAVLPGVIDSPMTNANLSSTQISNVRNASKFKRLASLKDVANSVYSLCSEENTGITGNFVKIDLGFSNVRNI